MSALSLSTTAMIFPDGASSETQAVNDTAAFHLDLDGTVQTLSSNASPGQGQIQGLLFVPSLPHHDPCNNIAAQFVPQNVTRQGDVSQLSDTIIGLAPWVSPACTRSFLNASWEAQPGALVFFHPTSNDTGMPPPGGDPSWNLNGSSDWESQNEYPVYAIPGPAGNKLMRQLSLYSRNSLNSTLNVPPIQHGEVRLYSVIDLGEDSSKALSVWGYILAILGGVLVISICITVFYQFMQRRHRAAIIQQRIAAGETDPERLGLGRVKVPREVLERLPNYPYPVPTSTQTSRTSSETDTPQLETVEQPKREEQPSTGHNTSSLPTEEEKDPTPPSPSTSSSSSSSKLPEQTGVSKSDSNNLSPSTCPDQAAARRLGHSQTTCAICLDDFVPQTSIVRELPCGHIFHSSCIDTFLTRNTCLCPLCKKSVLPLGWYRTRGSRRMVGREESRGEAAGRSQGSRS